MLPFAALFAVELIPEAIDKEDRQKQQRNSRNKWLCNSIVILGNTGVSFTYEIYFIFLFFFQFCGRLFTMTMLFLTISFYGIPINRSFIVPKRVQ